MNQHVYFRTFRSVHRSLSNLHESISLTFSKSVANWKSSDSIPVKLRIYNPYSAAIQVT